MSRALMEKFRGEQQELEHLAQQTMDAAEAEKRDLSEAELRSLGEYRARVAEIMQQIEPVAKYLETKASADELLKRGLGPAQQERAERPGSAPWSSFYDSEQYRSYSGFGSSGRYQLDYQTRAPITITAGLGEKLYPNPTKVVTVPQAAGTPLLDAIGYLPITSGSIDLIVYGTAGGATGFEEVEDGAQKPEGTLEGVETAVTPKTIAAYIEATRSALSEIPAMRERTDGQLRRGYRTKLEQLAAAAVASAAPTKVTGSAGESLLVVARKAIAALADDYIPGNYLLTSPANAAAFDIELLGKTLNGAKVGEDVWGLNVVQVPKLAKTIVGDVNTAITMVERTGVEIFATDSHGANFTKNIITILCEGKAKVAVTDLRCIREVATAPAVALAADGEAAPKRR